MNYDYKIINKNANLAFAKRVILYFGILVATVALALVVLFILFERYLMLLMPAGMFLFSAGIGFLIGRAPGAYTYSFSDKVLLIEGNGREVARISLEDISVEKTAEEKDFLDKSISKYTFFNNRVLFKIGMGTEDVSAQNLIVFQGEKRYLLGFDTYAISLIEGRKKDV